VILLKDKKHFTLGKNWNLYCHQIDSSHIDCGTKVLVGLLQLSHLDEMSVLDIGIAT
jgi:hypothetical protein